MVDIRRIGEQLMARRERLRLQFVILDPKLPNAPVNRAQRVQKPDRRGQAEQGIKLTARDAHPVSDLFTGGGPAMLSLKSHLS